MAHDPRHSQTYHFHTGFSGAVDKAAGVIRGVAVVTGNVTAQGHGLEVDDTTLSQLHRCASDLGQVPVNLDHQSGIKDTCGFLTNFRIEGGKVRADWFLLESHPEFAIMLERAERMPSCFGLSIAFRGISEKRGAKEFARCEKLVSVDCVTQPAANPGGLFSAREVDSTGKRMVEPTTTAEPTAPATPAGDPIAQLTATVADLTARLAAQEKFNEAVMKSMQEPTLEELTAMTDAELAELGITRAEVEAAAAGANPAAPAAPATPATPAVAMSAGEKALEELRQFKAGIAREKAAAKKAEEEHAFSVIEAKTKALAAQNKELTELSAKKDAEIAALRTAIRTGTRGVAPGVEGNVLFSAGAASAGTDLHAFQQRVLRFKTAGKSEAEALRFAIKEAPDEHRDWVLSLRK